MRFHTFLLSFWFKYLRERPTGARHGLGRSVAAACIEIARQRVLSFTPVPMEPAVPCRAVTT
jgi:hypothetical protein